VLGVQRTTFRALRDHRDRSADRLDLRAQSFNNEFASRVAFAATNERVSSATCDRKEFIGRNGTLSQPAALRRVSLAGRDGAGLDPCAALQVTIDLPMRRVSSCLAKLLRRRSPSWDVDGDLQSRAGIEPGAVAVPLDLRGGSAAGCDNVPLRPINSLLGHRWHSKLFSLVAAKATRLANSLLKGLCAKIEAVG